MLKKIQLRFSDFETPKHIKKSIQTLKEVFHSIQKHLGKDAGELIKASLDPDTMDIAIKALVEQIYMLDQTLTKADLYKTCHYLDEDGSGRISIDELMNYFSLELESHEKLQEQDSMLQDEIWPQWVVREKKLPEVETLLS